MYEMGITSQGFTEQIEKLNDFDDLVIRNFTPQMNRAVILIEGRVKPRIPVGVSGQTRRNVYHKVTSRVTRIMGANMITGVVGSRLKGPRPVVVELGRKSPGRMPPPLALVRWVQLILRIRSPRQALGVAYVIARNIGRRGFSPRGRIGPKGTRAYAKSFKESIREVIMFMEKGAQDLLDDLTVRVK